MAYKINEDLYIGNTNKQLKDLLAHYGDTLPIGAITEFDGSTIPDGYEEISEMSGSNANGSWIKFADGTMICSKEITITGINITNSWGALYESTSAISLGNFAQPFVEKPIVNVDKTEGQGSWLEVHENITTTSAGRCYVASAVSSSNKTLKFNIIAIGRWK